MFSVKPVHPFCSAKPEITPAVLHDAVDSIMTPPVFNSVIDKGKGTGLHLHFITAKKYTRGYDKSIAE